VLSDVVAAMTAIAAARATALGLDNVRTRVLDLEDIDEPDESYDVVLCREGLMFALDPARAAGEIQRVTRRGGRVALAVWGARECNPWLSVVFDAMSAQLATPVPPPGVPTPFSLGDADALAGLLSTAGLVDVDVTPQPVPLRVDSFDEWWARTSALTGPLANVVRALPEDAQRALRNRLQDAVHPYETSTGLDFPGITLLATARRA
jgi:SAM-dependent methyltransferase